MLAHMFMCQQKMGETVVIVAVSKNNWTNNNNIYVLINDILFINLLRFQSFRTLAGEVFKLN